MKKLKFTRYNLPLILIIILGAFLRLYKIKDYIVFLGDEGRDALVVYNILHGHLTLLGPTSSVGGFFLGPIYYYMMAPFLWLFHYDPVGPAIMVVLFGLATIYLVYKIGKEFFGEKAGLIASLLYSISPIVIIYSHSSWNPNVFPFFTISSLYSLYLAVTRRKWWLFALSGFLMGINLQIHYLATFVGVIMFLYVLFVDFKPKTAWLIQTSKQYLFMLAGFFLGFAPFLAFEARHSFTNTQNIIKFIFNSPDTGAGHQIFNNLQFVFTRLFGGMVLSFPSLADYHKYSSQILNIWYIASLTFGAVCVLLFLYIFRKKHKDKKEYGKYLLIFLWLAVGIGLFAFYKKSIYDYYLGFLYPVPFLLAGLLFSSIIKRFSQSGKIIVAILLFIIVFLNLKFTPILSIGNNQVDQAKTITNFVLSKTDNMPFNFALITGGNSDHAYRYFMTLDNRVPVTIQNQFVDPKRKTAVTQLLVVCESLPCYPLGNPLWEIAGFGRADIAGHWKVSVVEVYRLVYHE